MIAPTGRSIPDPPNDSEQRRLWKQRYHRDLYGWSPEEIERARRYGTYLPDTRPRHWFIRMLRRVWFWLAWFQFNITGLRLFWNQELRDYEDEHSATPVDFS